MARDIQIRNKVYSKDELDKVIDREFSFFVEEEVLDDELTVDEFFVAYEDLYFEIPIKGESNSHEYLVGRSNELANYEKDTQDIQPLLDEIASLREQLLTANETILELRTQEAGG